MGKVVSANRKSKTKAQEAQEAKEYIKFKENIKFKTFCNGYDPIEQVENLVKQAKRIVKTYGKK